MRAGPLSVKSDLGAGCESVITRRPTGGRLHHFKLSRKFEMKNRIDCRGGCGLCLRREPKQESAMAISALSPQHLWRAVRFRDVRLDGAFVYAVLSTGIYCRPSCPARRPRRSQVVFFHTAQAAQRSGFRACRRCWRQQAAHSAESSLVNRLCRALERKDENCSAGDLIRALAASSRMSRGRLRQSFQRLIGVTPRAYADQLRLHRLKNRLRQEKNVTTAMYDA